MRCKLGEVFRANVERRKFFVAYIVDSMIGCASRRQTRDFWISLLILDFACRTRYSATESYASSQLVWKQLVRL
jgi:hypothetical protein